MYVCCVCMLCVHVCVCMQHACTLHCTSLPTHTYTSTHSTFFRRVEKGQGFTNSLLQHASTTPHTLGCLYIVHTTPNWLSTTPQLSKACHVVTTTGSRQRTVTPEEPARAAVNPVASGSGEREEVNTSSDSKEVTTPATISSPRVQ